MLQHLERCHSDWVKAKISEFRTAEKPDLIPHNYAAHGAAIPPGHFSHQYQKGQSVPYKQIARPTSLHRGNNLDAPDHIQRERRRSPEAQQIGVLEDYVHALEANIMTGMFEKGNPYQAGTKRHLTNFSVASYRSRGVQSQPHGQSTPSRSRVTNESPLQAQVSSAVRTTPPSESQGKPHLNPEAVHAKNLAKLRAAGIFGSQLPSAPPGGANPGQQHLPVAMSTGPGIPKGSPARFPMQSHRGYARV